MPQAAPGGPVNAANLNFEGLDQVENVVGTDLVLVAIGAGQPNAFATVTQLLAGAGVPDPLLLGDGTAAAPSYSFASDPNTGFFLSAVDQLGLVAGGVRVANLVEAAGNVQLIVPLQDNATAPSIAFGNGSYGFYSNVDDSIFVSIAGAARWNFVSTNLSANATDGPSLTAQNATATIPVFRFVSDTDTGIGRAAPNQLSLIAGGAQILQITTTESIFHQNIRANATSGPAVLNTNASGTIPTLIPDRSDPNTGIGHNVADQLSFIAGGLSCISIRNLAGARQIGFYDGSPISLQTGVAVTTAAVHAALVALRLITA